jgi:hypothetical protein
MKECDCQTMGNKGDLNIYVTHTKLSDDVSAVTFTIELLDGTKHI